MKSLRENIFKKINNLKTQPEVYCFKTMYQGVQFLENVNKFLLRKSTEDNDTNHKIILTH